MGRDSGRRARAVVAVVAVAVAAVLGAVLLVRAASGSAPAAGGGAGAGADRVAPRSASPASPSVTYRSTRIAAHRGAGQQVAGRAVVPGAPEESLPALRRAAEHGDVVELDLRFTSDHQPVAIHDATTDRTMTCPGREVAETSLATLRSRCDLRGATGTGDRDIATWRQVLAVVQDNPGTTALVEIKVAPDAADVRHVVEPIARLGLADRLVVNSFSSANITAVTSYARAQGLSLQTGLLATSARTRSFVRAGKAAATTIRREAGAGVLMVAPYYTQVTAAWVRQMHAAGLQVWAWCPDTAAALRTMQADQVDVVITDYPDVARAVLHTG